VLLNSTSFSPFTIRSNFTLKFPSTSSCPKRSLSLQTSSTEVSRISLLSIMRAKCTVHLILLHLNSRKYIVDEQLKSKNLYCAFPLLYFSPAAFMKHTFVILSLNLYMDDHLCRLSATDYSSCLQMSSLPSSTCN